MGEMLPARRAGPRAAARVTTIPTTTAATNAETGRLGSSSVTSPTVRTQATMTAASSEPMATPRSDPTTPSRNAWRRTNPVIWPRVAPAARRRPSSRARSTSVMESVLKMRNAPVNSAIAAMSAVVAWKSAVEDAERGGEVGRRRQHVRLDEQASFERGRDGLRIRAVGEREVDPGDGVLVEGRPARSAAAR